MSMIAPRGKRQLSEHQIHQHIRCGMGKLELAKCFNQRLIGAGLAEVCPDSGIYRRALEPLESLSKEQTR